VWCSLDGTWSDTGSGRPDPNAEWGCRSALKNRIFGVGIALVHLKGVREEFFASKSRTELLQGLIVRTVGPPLPSAIVQRNRKAATQRGGPVMTSTLQCSALGRGEDPEQAGPECHTMALAGTPFFRVGCRRGILHEFRYHREKPASWYQKRSGRIGAVRVRGKDGDERLQHILDEPLKRLGVDLIDRFGMRSDS